MRRLALLLGLTAAASTFMATPTRAETDDPFAIVGPSRLLTGAEIEQFRADPALRREVLASGIDDAVAAKRLDARSRDAAVNERLAKWRVWEFGAGTPTHQTFAAPRGTRLVVREGRNADGYPTWEIGIAFRAPSKGQVAPPGGAIGPRAAHESWSQFMSTSVDHNLGCGFWDTVCFKGNYYYRGNVLWNYGSGCDTKDYFALSWHVNVTSKWGGLKRSWVQAHLTGGGSAPQYREKVYPLSTVTAPTGSCTTGNLTIGITYGAISVGAGQSYQVCGHESMGPVAVSNPDGASQWRSDDGLHDNDGRSFQGALIFSQQGGGGGYTWWTGHSR